MKNVSVNVNLEFITTETEYLEAIESAVEQFSQLGDLYFKTQVINGLRERNAGNKGRIAVPEFMKKIKPESIGNGKKGRPSDSAEVKLQKMEAKLIEARNKLTSSVNDLELAN